MSNQTTLEYAQEIKKYEKILNEKDNEIKELEETIKYMNDALLGDDLDCSDNLEHASSLIHVKDEYIKELKEKITKMNKEIKLSEYYVKR